MELEISALAQDGVTGITLATWNPDRLMPVASLAKLLIAVALLSLHDVRDLDRIHPLITRSAALHGGGPYVNPDRYAHTSARALLGLMISESDNVAANALIDYVSVDSINRTARTLDLKHMRIHGHFFSSSSMARAKIHSTAREFNKLVAYVLGQTRSNQWRHQDAARLLVQLMIEQTDRRFLPSVVHDRVVADKTGEVEGEINDSGIVDPFGERPMVVTILCHGAFDPEDAISYQSAVSTMQARTRKLYDTAVARQDLG